MPEIVLLAPVAEAEAEKFIRAVHPTVCARPARAERLRLCLRFRLRLRLRAREARGLTARPAVFYLLRRAQDRDKQTCFAVEGGKLRVKNSRGCRGCRERVRMLSGEAPFEGKVQMRRVKEHYIFTIESVGQLPPEDLFVEAVNLLQEKCATLLSVM